MNRVVQTSSQASEVKNTRLIIALLMIGFVLPFSFFAGGLRLSPYRLVLLMMFVPSFVFWLSGRGGKMRAIDYFMMIVVFWPPLALIANHGIAQTWQFNGMYVIEAATPFLMARVLIRDLKTFRFFVWFYFAVVLFLLPFAVVEAVTGRPVLLDFFDRFFKVYHITNKELRLGLRRAQSTFPHPILFGLFCSPIFAMAWYSLRSKKTGRRQIRYSLVSATAVFFSLSSGALMSVTVQLLLMSWDFVLRQFTQRWKVLLTIAIILYTILELASGRSMFQIMATTLTFDTGNSYTRVLIFRHASDDILANPIFGLGWRDWTRPHWLKPSVDNFWLLQALSYGFPALFGYVATLLSLFIPVSKAKISGELADARTGYLIAVFGLSFAVITVHMWDAIFSLYMFLLGAGVWFMDAKGDNDEVERTEIKQTGRGAPNYTRFPSGMRAAGASVRAANKTTRLSDDRQEPTHHLAQRSP